MGSKTGLALLIALLGTVPSAYADTQQVRQCLGEDGKLYKTTQSSCPQSMPEIRKKIQSCVLPDGSKAFGDKCPQGAAAKESLDSQALSSRDSGLKNQYRYDEQRMIQQGEYERSRLRMQQQYDQSVEERNRQIRVIRERQTERSYRPDN